MEHQPRLVPWHHNHDVRAATLILPGGVLNSRGRYWSVVDLGLRGLARRLARQGTPSGLAVYLLRYRYLGWNGDHADTAVDAEWALELIGRRHGDIPVALVGNSLGGAAAFRVAGHPRVASVVGVAPWLPGNERIDVLTGRKVMIIHGDRDLHAAPAPLSLAFAERARHVVPDLARFEVVGGRHNLVRRSRDWWAATTNFALGTVGTARLAPAIRAAMSAPAPSGLRMPLPIPFRA